MSGPVAFHQLLGDFGVDGDRDFTDAALLLSNLGMDVEPCNRHVGPTHDGGIAALDFVKFLFPA